MYITPLNSCRKKMRKRERGKKKEKSRKYLLVWIANQTTEIFVQQLFGPQSCVVAFTGCSDAIRRQLLQIFNFLPSFISTYQPWLQSFEPRSPSL